MCWLQKILSLPTPVKEVICPNEAEKERLRIEKGLKYVPKDGYPKMSCNGVELELVYDYKESRYTKYENEMQVFGEEDEGIRVVEQNWTYYSWNKIYRFWERQSGHRQTCDEESYELMNKKEVEDN